MVFLIHEQKAPLFRGRPDFTPSEFYGRKLKKLDRSEIGFFFDEVTQRMVRVMSSSTIPLRDEQTQKPVLGLMMTEEVFLAKTGAVAKSAPVA